MTVETTHSKNTYTGNGSQTVYAFTFRVWLTTEVIVLVDNAVQSPTIAIDSSGVGGTVTFSSAPALGAEIIIKRAVEQKQPSTFPLRAKLDTTELEELLDRMVGMTQDNTRDLLANTFNWRGTWSATETYQTGDAVYWAGTTYRSLSEQINHEPPNATYWAIVASKGDSGGLVWQGAWDSGTSYAVGDGVTNDGSSYICIASSTNNEPPNATYWEVLAEAGVDGAMSGPGSSVANRITTFSDASGNIVKDSGLVLPTSFASSAYRRWRMNSSSNGFELLDASPSTLTISSGSITPSKPMHIIAPEGAAPDDLATIVTTGVEDGHQLTLLSDGGGNAVTVKNSGNINTYDGNDFIIEDGYYIKLVRNGADWFEIGRFSAATGDQTNSSEYTPSAGGTITWAHGQAAVPKTFFALLRCATADNGYSVNDYAVPVHNIYDSGTGAAHVIYATSVNVVFKNSATFGIFLPNRSTFTHTLLTMARWRVTMVARS